MRASRIIVMGAALCLVLAACGGGTAATAPAPSDGAPAASPGGPDATTSGGGAGSVPNACSLLTKDQVAAILGEAAADPSPGLNVDPTEASTCDWQQAQVAGVLKLLQVEVWVSTKFLSKKGYSADELAPGDTTIPGADAAFVIAEDGGRGVGINMEVGGRRVVVHYRDGTKTTTAPTTYLDALKTIAAEVAAAVAKA